MILDDNLKNQNSDTGTENENPEIEKNLEEKEINNLSANDQEQEKNNDQKKEKNNSQNIFKILRETQKQLKEIQNENYENKLKLKLKTDDDFIIQQAKNGIKYFTNQGKTHEEALKLYIEKSGFNLNKKEEEKKEEYKEILPNNFSTNKEPELKEISEKKQKDYELLVEELNKKNISF